MTVLKHKKVNIRKPHPCWGCCKTFTDAVMTNHVETWDGGVSSVYTCEPCQSWLDENTKDWGIEDWESTFPGEIGYWKDGVWHPQSYN